MMADLGFMGMMVDPKYGGSGLDSILCCSYDCAKVDASAAVIMSVNNSLVCAGLEKYCNEEQKMKYLVPLARVIGAFVYQSQKRDLMQHLKNRLELFVEQKLL
jgi:alkylation response protein AidB-like acyl-CoA dehydrogenase